MSKEAREALEGLVRDYGFRKLHRDTGMSQTALNNIVKGRSVPRIAKAKLIARTLGKDLDEIIWPQGYQERLPEGPIRLGGLEDLRHVRGDELRRVVAERYGVVLRPHEELRAEPDDERFYQDQELFAAIALGIDRRMEELKEQQQEISERLEKLEGVIKKITEQVDMET